ncbi:helix-turn-helix domain-containing protein [Cupriavidus sp. YAF13]|uniref:helix-turn-helix domain-containing protein n=1 Tax=Cupriavidus sp. YAF13 TaxID=3233075 RepID=UPI003F8DC6A2
MRKLEGVAGFVAVVEAGAISGAARRVHLSKSVVSERLADLEKISLGATLLRRTTRRLAPSRNGAPPPDPESIDIVHAEVRCVPARLGTFVECVRTAIGSPAYQDEWAGPHDPAEVA